MTASAIRSGPGAADTGDRHKAASLGGKYLTFRLAEEAYGIEILKVQEIIRMADITRIPRTPSYVQGVINLRGRVIPVLDLRLKFGLKQAEPTEKTCIIVVQIARDQNRVTMGIIVDEVSEVLDVPAEKIDSPPMFGDSGSTQFILGMARTEKSVTILLDIDRILLVEEIVEIRSIA